MEVSGEFSRLVLLKYSQKAISEISAGLLELLANDFKMDTTLRQMRSLELRVCWL